MPDIHFACPKCSQTIDAPQEMAAQLIECPTCKETIEVPVRSQRKEAPKQPEPPKPAPTTLTPAPAIPPKYGFQDIQDSSVATALTVIAALELLLSPFAGLGCGDSNTELGWLVFVSGVISGLILLGFARVIQNTFESSQRLRRLEILMEKALDKKPAA